MSSRLPIYAAIRTCGRRAASLERTLAMLAGTPWDWQVNMAPDLADGMEANRQGYIAVLEAAQASGAEWLLSIEDDVSLVGDPARIVELTQFAWPRLRYAYLADRAQPECAGEPVCGVGTVMVRRLTPLARGLQALLLRADAIPLTLSIAREPTTRSMMSAFLAHCRPSWGGVAVLTPLFTERRSTEPSLLFP